MGHYISECPIIPDPEMNYKEMPGAFFRARDKFLATLKKYGINEHIEVRLDRFGGEQRCWLALYIRETQFRGDPRFAVNSATPGIIDAAVLPQSVTVEDVFEDSLYHEYGHVIEEYAKRKDRDLYNMIYGPFSDEEDFSEYMVDYFRYHKDRSMRDLTDRIVKLYVKDVFG